MGQAFGATIVRAKNLMHGKTDMIHHDGRRLFAGLDNPFQATRYHSLVIQPDTLSERIRSHRLGRGAGRLSRDHGHRPPRVSAVRRAVSSGEFFDALGIRHPAVVLGGVKIFATEITEDTEK